jgi:hypothetical protein
MAVRKSGAIARFAIIAILLSLFSFNVHSQTPRIIVENGKVWVKDIQPEVLYTFSRYFNSQKDWEAVFPVFLKENVNGIVMTGSYEVFRDAVSFTPRFPFAPKVFYQARFFADQLAQNMNEVYLPQMNATTLELDFSIEHPATKAAVVTAVYPSDNVLPENLLKFHICFSKSMSLGEAYLRIKLLDAGGKEIPKPFLIIDQELWDPEMKTLTILFDPGRIKRGLRPNLEMKPALENKHQYSLVIEKGWKDIDGNLSQTTFEKSFKCGPADRTSPDLSLYNVRSPQFENSPLVIELNEPVDYVLSSEALRVKDSKGNMVEGIIVSRRNETVLEFVPKNPWSDTHYTIQFNPLLEDLVGNNLNRLFDEDLSSPRQPNRAPDTLPFQITRTAR